MVLGPFRDSNTVAQDFVLTSLLVQLECIGPELIMLRVVLGRAWNTLQREKGTQLSTMQFESNPVQRKVETTSESGDNSSIREHDPDV
ncbi:hypothetical protein CPB85DRAFT_452802 [Mucidula mucida]|nr:hypothetical protein CPB85DRAFT_452802 [Mucidula mucida]